MPRADLPSGTVTFLFTDVEGSTRLLYELGAERYAKALAEHRRVIREACASDGGVEVDTQGDAFFFAFPSGPGALAAASAFTEALSAGPIQVRVGLHTGTPLVSEEGYVGDDVHFAARVAASSHGGQIVLSAATARAVQASGSEPQALPLLELGEHRLKDVAVPVSIYQLGDGSFPPLKTISNTNLPRPASSFVGRERELADVLARIERGARLLTLTGPGGSGKTRLALEAAATLVPEYKAGVFWVGLAALRDPALVTETISQTLGAKDGLAEHIGERDMLLLLDNLEQVVEAARELASLLERCPKLTLLVTSRELLRVRGEVEYSVPPLAEPEAVTLFCERSGLEPSEEIAELCARLDSLPLAVELAAARTKVLTPAQIGERLSQRLDLLKGGRDADPRQQTLRATIEWSYDLLSSEEQLLFARLSVFAGGCTLEAAEEVADADLDTLQSLVEKSLLRFSNERYWMLETIREYAEERSQALGEEVTRRRLRAYVVDFVEKQAANLQSSEEAAISAELERDYANIRQAVSFALQAQKPDDVGRVLYALFPFLIARGHITEARSWVDALLASRDGFSCESRLPTLVGASEIARFGGDLALAEELKKELLTFARDDPEAASWSAPTLADLSDIAMERGDFELSRKYVLESLSLGGGARAELSLADLDLRVGDLAAARIHCAAALAGLQEGEFNHASALEILGEVARQSGDIVAARLHFARSIGMFAALGDGGGVADCLDAFARIAIDEGDLDRADRLLGAAQHQRTVSGRRPLRADLPTPIVSELALSWGAALTLDEAVEYVTATID